MAVCVRSEARPEAKKLEFGREATPIVGKRPLFSAPGPPGPEVRTGTDDESDDELDPMSPADAKMRLLPLD
jgi:hypothetical protein